MGGDLEGGWGGRAPKFEVEDGSCIRLSVPPIFREVVSLDACESTN